MGTGVRTLDIVSDLTLAVLIDKLKIVSCIETLTDFQIVQLRRVVRYYSNIYRA